MEERIYNKKILAIAIAEIETSTSETMKWPLNLFIEEIWYHFWFSVLRL